MSNTTNTLYVEPKGIGGWLILPALTTVFFPLVALLAVVETLPILWMDMSADLRIFAAGHLVFSLALTVGWIVAAIRMFKHKRSFPSLFITMLVVGVAGVLVEALISTSVFGSPLEQEDYRDLVKTFVSLLIWSPYMAASKRVRNTFIES